MSVIANRRNLLEAANVLVRTRQPTMAQYEAVATALAQVFADDTCLNVECVIRSVSDQSTATEQTKEQTK